MKWLRRLLEMKVMMVEIVSTVSFGMLLVWLLLHEYHGLFGH